MSGTESKLKQALRFLGNGKDSEGSCQICSACVVSEAEEDLDGWRTRWISRVETG